jgi:ParB-like chromosome segregation protein Spo0J
MVIEADLDLRCVSSASEPAINDYCTDIMNRLDQLPREQVPVGSVVPGPYLREAGTNHAHVQLLADASSRSALPPILVQRSGHRIIDGMHRLAAAKLRGERSITAYLIDCSDAAALVLAIRSNTLHGLPLSRADRISGAKRILMAHPDWSDRAVASVTGMSAKTIAVLRNRSSGEVLSFEKRLGLDGKRRPVVTAEGRKRAAAYIGAHPEASIRMVARAADVSVGTVHSVRRLMRQGNDPIAPAAAREAPAGQRPARRPQHARECQPLAWSGISIKVTNDPALRYTEGGRAFLRWMAQHALDAEDWRELVSAVPAHWLEDICTVAESVSTEWHMFAAHLRTRIA